MDILKDSLESVENIFDSAGNGAENQLRRQLLIEIRDRLNAEIDELMDPRLEFYYMGIVDDISKMSMADINNMSFHPAQVKSGDITSSENELKKRAFHLPLEEEGAAHSSKFNPDRWFDIFDVTNKNEDLEEV